MKRVKKEIIMSEAIINKSIFFAASRETVWAFLTEKDKLALWFFDAENDLADGKDYKLIQQEDDGSISTMCWGTVLEMDNPERLVYSFSIKPFPDSKTTVIWELEEALGGTKLSLFHKGIGATGDAALGLIMALDAGWDKHFAKMREAIA
jgi:uncharacterized protein YndB with AHSA1/START domain